MMTSTKIRIVLFVLATITLHVIFAGPAPEDVRPIRDGHSHNDYWRNHPMLDALDHGFCSVEADVFLRDGQFWAGHVKAEILLRRNLETIYLKTLKERIEKNGGTVYPGVETFYLWIEFKEDPEEAWAALAPLLEKYKEILCSVTDGVKKPGPVQVIITGNRPFRSFEDSKGKTFYATLDGRFGDLDNPNRPAWMVGAINESWGSVCSWKGKGEFPADERAKLQALIEKAHSQGRLLRFWGAPQNETFWTELRRLKVDFINTDHLTTFRNFDLKYKPE
ncbi:MAG: hypothetical protein K6C40_06245 [Thermoguttaceae bacterium]|nr:hypothetical protein [Thermoguttaceae bacterium]